MPKKRGRLTRRQLIEQLVGSCDHRGGRNYNNKQWLFCFDVRLHGIKTDFDRLLQRHRESATTDDAALAASHIDACRRYYEKLEEQAREFLVENAVESAKAVYETQEAWTVPKLKRPVSLGFEFMGRSGGWLILTQFDGITLVDNHGWLHEVSDNFLRRLYATVNMLRGYLADPCARVETEMAFMLFYCLSADALETSATQLYATAKSRRIDTAPYVAKPAQVIKPAARLLT